MKLFKDRNLNISMLISVSCHLIGIFLIIPVLSLGVTREEPAVISFLGSILEKVSVVPEKTFNLQKFSDGANREMPRHGILEGLDFTSPEIGLNILSLSPDKEKSAFSEAKQDILASDAYYGRKKSLQIEFKGFDITGKAKNRTVMYKPPMPVLVVFNSYFSSDYSVSVRFKVSRHGFIEQPECIISSGSSEVDNAAIRYIRRWQFIPSDKGERFAHEGVMRLNFDIS